MAVRQGTIGWVEFSPSRGHEQRGRRPALVVSADAFNEAMHGLAWMIPITSRIKSRPDEISVPDGLPISGVFLFSQIKTLDLRERAFEPICVLDEDFFASTILGTLIAVLLGDRPLT